MMRIDSHQHFWEYDAIQYPWITDKLARIRRSFLPPDLEPELKRAGLDGCIAVQARQTVQESHWLLKLADQYPFIKGVVGWVDLRADNVERDLEELAKHPKFVGVRHVAQDEPDDRFLVGKNFLRGISKLKQFDLAYDILIFPKQMPAAIELVNRFPEQRFVLDHIAKPFIRDGVMEPWRTQIRELAKAPNVTCKVSGMVTEAKWDCWKSEDFLPYLEVVADAFGFQRLMYGSDWPVCLLAAANYESVYELVDRWASRLGVPHRLILFSETCAFFYRIPLEGKDALSGLPGEALIRKGFKDLAAGAETVEALLIHIGSPKLAFLGLAVPERIDANADRRLYELLCKTHDNEAHTEYNRLTAELYQFSQALSRRQSALENRSNLR